METINYWIGRGGSTPWIARKLDINLSTFLFRIYLKLVCMYSVPKEQLSQCVKNQEEMGVFHEIRRRELICVLNRWTFIVHDNDVFKSTFLKLEKQMLM